MFSGSGESCTLWGVLRFAPLKKYNERDLIWLLIQLLLIS